MKPSSIVKLSSKALVRLESLDKFVRMPKELKTSGLAFSKDFKAGVVVDVKGSPKYFVFDTASLWDLLCAIDEKYEANVSTKEYVLHNPVGWLIDEIEAHMPLNPKLIAKLKKGIKEAEKLGLVPYEKVKHELGLN